MPTTHNIEISRQGNAWKVSKPSGQIKAGDTVSWKFASGTTPDDAKACFQFTNQEYIDLATSRNVSADWTSKRPLGAGADESFDIKIKKIKTRDDADTVVRKFHYAVLISGKGVNPDKKYTGSTDLAWAVGGNPPPELDVGK